VLEKIAPPAPFVVGHPRSGTTLLRAMLDSHPELAIPWESYFIPLMWPRHQLFEGSSFSIQLFLAALAETPQEIWRMDRELLASSMQKDNPQSFQEAVRCVYATYARMQRKPRWGDKTPDYMLHMDLISGLLPEARFIHIIRDGRDVATSLMQVSWGVSRVADAAVSWSWRVTHARNIGRRLGPEKYMEVRYEDLVDNPESVLAALCSFLDLEYDSHMLRYQERVDMILTVEPSPQYHQHLHLAPTIGLRDWRTEMQAEDAVVFDFIAGDVLAELGYTDSGRSA
jgi:hypothetical protein